MSITVRLWSDKDLEDIKSGKDKWKSTIFMNRTTFSEKEIKYYPYNQRREYLAELEGEEEPIRIYATDDKMAKKFLDAEYRTKEYPIISLVEKICSYKTCKLKTVK